MTIRPALTIEKPQVVEWMHSHFPVWVAEAEASFCRLPVSCFLAVRGRESLGFACYDATCRNFFGPTGVLEEERGRGLGRALLLAVLRAQRGAGLCLFDHWRRGPSGVLLEDGGCGADRRIDSRCVRGSSLHRDTRRLRVRLAGVGSSWHRGAI